MHARVGEPSKIEQRKFKYIGYVGDHGEKAEQAAKEEAIRKGVTTSEEWDAEERLFGLYQEQQAGGNGPFLAGAIGVIVLAWFILG